MWYNEDEKTPKEIAELLHRDKSSITRLVVQERELKKQGRPPAFTEAQIDRMVDKLEAMILEANQEWRVTAEMLVKALRIQASRKHLTSSLRMGP